MPDERPAVRRAIRLANRQANRILIVAPAWVGDMVMAHTLVRVLRSTRPNAHIHMLAPPATAALAERLAGVDACTVLDVAHGQLGLAARRAAARVLVKSDFEQAIVLPNSFKSALVPWLAGVPKRTGWLGELRYGLLNDHRRLDKARYPLMIERFMALGLPARTPLEPPYPCPELTTDGDNQERLRARFGIATVGAVALCPGAEFGPAKRWPVEHFAALAGHLVASGRQVLLLGSSRDVAACDAIADLVSGDLVSADPASGDPVSGDAADPCRGLVNLAGQTRLVDAVDVLGMASRVVSNDSGLMHVAGAVGTRVVALFGSSSTDFTPPLGDAEVLELDLDCRPCFQRTCPLGHLACLRQLTPERVAAAL